jgi:hypothetical protein
MADQGRAFGQSAKRFCLGTPMSIQFSGATS